MSPLLDHAQEAAERLYDLALCSPHNSLMRRTNMRIAEALAEAIKNERNPTKIGGDQ